MRVIERTDFGALFQALAARGYELLGPTIRDEAIVYDVLQGVDDLPEGWTDEQDGGHYRLHRRDDRALFGYVVGPHSWKKYLFPPRQEVFRAHREDGELRIVPATPEAPKRAFFGVRSCELHALAIQDQVFSGGPYVDTAYQSRRDNVFIVAVNCGEPGGTCFCTSMGTGPEAQSGYDLVLTEVLADDRHYFTAETGSDAGQEVLAEVPSREADEPERAAAEAVPARAAEQMGRSMEVEGIRDLLMGNLEHPRWDEVADRCLSCANCTLVCPTCFCSSVEDTTDLAGEQARRERVWDSCFNESFSYVAGGSVRESTASRYRQWMTHKLATWYDQFGTSGCVGCGRCITWCPVAIDITEEARAIRANDQRSENGS